LTPVSITPFIISQAAMIGIISPDPYRDLIKG